ncbi:MAG: 3-hydroxyacyl-ACP dehydratase FabZ family protein [Gemmatimonadota bacterium]|nr:3-hydroxyacyl-ACP dehydratase FabZ family protein [Gemmatimonadota bacterium]
MSDVAAGVVLTPEEVLAMLPQKEPFLFVDEVVEVSGEHIVARFTFREDHDFYRGHFPGRPVTPGVILLESLAQVGVVALGLYLIARDQGREAVLDALALFTDANIEFTGLVSPGDRVTIRATKVFFRRGKIRSAAEMTLDDGTVVCSGTISGMGVPRQ